MSNPIQVYIEWCVNYNGVYLFPVDESLSDNDELMNVLEAASNDLPSVTWDLVGKETMEAINNGEFDHPEDIEIEESILINAAQEKLGDGFEVTHIKYNASDT